MCRAFHWRVSRQEDFGKALVVQSVPCLSRFSADYWCLRVAGALSYPWAAIAIALVGLFALREGRAYPIPDSNFGGYAGGPYGDYRPRVSDGATWGDVHHRDRNIVPYSQKSDLREMRGRRFREHRFGFWKTFRQISASHSPATSGACQADCRQRTLPAQRQKRKARTAQEREVIG